MVSILLRILFFASALGVSGLVMVQMSEHSGLGGAFGAGASSTVFGREEQTDPKRTATSVLAAVFLFTGLALSII